MAKPPLDKTPFNVVCFIMDITRKCPHCGKHYFYVEGKPCPHCSKGENDGMDIFNDIFGVNPFSNLGENYNEQYL